MYLALDVHYKSNYAKSVGLTFLNKSDNEPQETLIETIEHIAPYQPGEFYKRELPCLLEVISKIDLNCINAILIDGHVYVDNDGRYGLGGYLYQALENKTPIIGIAKRAFHANKNTVKEVYRGTSNNPLHISAIGIDLDAAAQFIKEMHGNHRHPTLLKTLDTITKSE
ncbi:endonuclease V [Psychroserpens luteolus]|uniref:endonuclease V n=1 Tax=Psychroserpens luteolus TaxID=2855840 RepID=UPI001E5A33DB|nr:endonuclease V [Psychroserpens luteolus]MCD2258294.1 endonuclease V [Psychroserpens luteolus]